VSSFQRAASNAENVQPVGRAYFYGGAGRAPSANCFFVFFLSSPPAAPHEFFRALVKEREELTQINTQLA
jgi:hypothetical protein